GQGKTEKSADHHHFALAEINTLARGIGELETVSYQGIDEAHQRPAHDHLPNDGSVHERFSTEDEGNGILLAFLDRGILDQTLPVGVVAEYHPAVLHHAHHNLCAAEGLVRVLVRRVPLAKGLLPGGDDAMDWFF